MDVSASPPGGEVVGACDRLLRQVAKVIVKTKLGHEPPRSKLLPGCGNAVGTGPENDGVSRFTAHRATRCGAGREPQPLADKSRTGLK